MTHKHMPRKKAMPASKRKTSFKKPMKPFGKGNNGDGRYPI